MVCYGRPHVPGDARLRGQNRAAEVVNYGISGSRALRCVEDHFYRLYPAEEGGLEVELYLYPQH